MIMVQEQPFKLVDHPAFRAFVASLQPRFQIFGRATVKTDIMKLYQTMKKSLFLDIAKVDRVALTTDLWTSSNQTPFMVVSAHFISNDWTLNKRLISFKPLPTPHTGIAISDQLISTIVEWKLIDKVAFITVDNASSNDVAIS
jgi:hypothetical protein